MQFCHRWMSIYSWPNLFVFKNDNYISLNVQNVNRELPDVQASFIKGRGIRDQITNICWIIKKAREF